MCPHSNTQLASRYEMQDLGDQKQIYLQTLKTANKTKSLIKY